MKILVTGYKGFIGQNMCQFLISQGHEVEGWEFMENAIPDPSKYDWVIHLGAISDTTCTNVEQIMSQNFENSLLFGGGSSHRKAKPSRARGAGARHATRGRVTIRSLPPTVALNYVDDLHLGRSMPLARSAHLQPTLQAIVSSFKFAPTHLLLLTPLLAPLVALLVALLAALRASS